MVILLSRAKVVVLNFFQVHRNQKQAYYFYVKSTVARLIQYPKPNPMNWNAILAVVCILSFMLPIAVIVYNRYYTHQSLAALLIYYSIIVIDNLVAEHFIPSTPAIEKYVGLLDNYADIPLMLTGLLFFCPSKQKQSRIRLLTILFVVYELVLTGILGFSRTAVIWIMAAGIPIIIIYSFYLFFRQVKFSIFHGKNHGRVLMLSGILFGYSCYLLIYYFHYIQKTPFEADVFKLYYISSIVSSLLMAIGLHMMRNRMKELRTLKITRKELAVFFGQHEMQ